MPNWAETRLALQGILKLARFDPDFVRFFDHSRAGALRSFWVSAAIYPYILLISWLDPPAAVSNDGRYLAAVTVYFALSCFILPVVLLTLAPILQRVDEVMVCITVLNWMGVLMVVLGLPFIALEHMGLSIEAQDILSYLSVVIAAVFEYFAMRHALRIGWQIAFGLTGADVYLSHVLILPVLHVAISR
jgi:hypothetical protein